MNSFFRRQPKLERPAPSLNDCDLEARQQQSIERSGRTNAEKVYQKPWKATDSDGNTGEVDPSVYREGSDS